jgi:DNA-binding Lrp family transcriptional regulator
MSQPALRPQDVVVLAKLLAYGGFRPPMAEIAADLSISASEVHAALKRLERARLLATDPTGTRPLLQAVEEFLVHGVKYAFPAKRGEVTRGVPTSYAGPPLNGKLAADDLPPVWPHPEGAARGVALEPLYPSAPVAALRDPALYELLALIDAIREGRARERKLAEDELRARIHRITDERPKSAAPRKRR